MKQITGSILSAFLLVFLVAGCQTTQLSRVSVYYVPYQFTSSEAVTPDSIKEKATAIDITDKRALISIEKLLASAKDKPGFDAKRVRMLLVMTPGGRSVYLDADGNSLEAGKEKHLPSGKFDQLQSIVGDAVSTDGAMK